MDAFIKMNKYKIRNGGVHLDHVLRKKTILVKNPKIPEVIGEINLKKEQVKRKDGVFYYEVMVSEVEKSCLEKIRYFLIERLNREVLCVYHTDESHPHAHYIVRWHDEKGKALRLKISDFEEIKKEIANTIGHELKFSGGRKRLSLREYMVSPNAFQATQAIKMRDGFVRASLQQLLSLYKEGFRIYALSNKGGLPLEEIKSKEDIEKVSIKRLRFLENKGDDICFAPSPETKTIFLDDVSFDVIKDLPKEGLVVRTSPNTYQVHIRIENTNFPLKSLQTMFVHRYGAYIGSNSISYLRRVPCFANHNYQDKPEVAFVNNPGNANLNDVLQKIEYSIMFEKEKKKNILSVPINRRGSKKRWVDFKDGCKSFSEVDMRYAIYLLGRGVSDGDVSLLLKKESEGIFARKEGRLKDYIERIIKTAKEYIIMQAGLQVRQDTNTQPISPIAPKAFPLIKKNLL